MKKIAVLIPCYNEVLTALLAFFAGLILDNMIRNERKSYELKYNNFN